MKILHSISLISALLLTCACANTGTPGGGPKDVTPPTLLKTEPQENQTNYSKKRVTLYFDELVSLDNAAQKVIISPPQKIPPITKAIANKISVLFEDSLKDETTYTIDFTDAIVDYNEKNKFGDYAFSFSTGAVVDSFRISGVLLDASNLNPISGVIVGVHGLSGNLPCPAGRYTRCVGCQNPYSGIRALSKGN